MDFSNYMIVTDLDGTFLGCGSRLLPRNIEAIERFKAGGGLFTIATGRLHLNIRSALGDPAALVNAPLICCNGGYLYDPRTGRISDGDLIPAEDARDILAFIRSRCPDLTFRVSSPHSVRVESAEGLAGQDLASFDEGVAEIWAPAEEWPAGDWYKIVIRGENPRLSEARLDFARAFGSRLTATAAGRRLWEVQSPHVNKALGLQKLKKADDGIGNSRIIIACGDHENDLAMLRAADVAVCPANAIEDVKAIADHILCDCDEGLIADVVEAIEVGKMQKRRETV